MELDAPDDRSPTVACTFGWLTAAVSRLNLIDERQAAVDRLKEIAADWESCLATEATGAQCAAREDLTCRHDPWDECAAVLTATGRPVDDRPCHFCGDD